MLDIAKQGIFQRIRLVIADRQPIVLQGLKSVLAAQQDFDIVASFSDATSCLEAIRKLTPDVALVADTLPDLTISKILAIAKAEKLSTRLVFFTEYDTDEDLAAAIAVGACSAISKYASPATMLRSLRLMTKSGVSLEQSDLAPTGKEFDGGKIEKMLELLTHRERQIVRLVSEGLSNKEIARQLDVSHGTVKVHLYNIFQKLEITNRTVLATIALLQRASGFGALSLALLVIAVADELKASEANDVLPDDDSIGHAGGHAEYEPWKKAILRHRIVWESSETQPRTQRDFPAKEGQVTDPAAAMEALHTAEQSAGPKPLKDHGPVGSSTPNPPALSLRTNDTQIGGDPAPDHLVPRLASNPMSLQGGYGTFATLAGALIYALHDPNLAAAQTHDAGHASIDSFLAVTGENATTNLAPISDAGAHHVDNSAPALPSHDSHPPSAFVTTGNESVAGEGDRGQISHGAEGDAAGENLQKPVGLLDFGQDASVGGYSRDQLVGGNVDENVVHRSSIDSSSTSSDAVFDFGSGASRINLAAFGALAWLHMTAASKSIPPHTLAWIYDPASNETIVYVNPTDRSLDIGDRGLVEIHLQGIVSVAEQDFVGQPEGAAVAITLEQLEAALISAAATDETVLSADNVHAIGGGSESTLETAGVWNIRADDGLRFQFGQTRTGSGASTRFRSSGDSANATEESDSASAVSAHASSTGLVHSVTVTAVENPTLKSGPINAGIGVSSTGLNEIIQPSVVTADSGGQGNSEHASEQGSERAAATEATEADTKPGNGVGNGAELHAEKTAEPASEHGNSGHDSHSPSANAPEAAEVVASVATADKAGRGNSQNASEPESAKAVAKESTVAGSTPSNGVGNDKTTAESADEKHGKSGHDSHSPAANAPEATEVAESSVATADKAGRGNSQQASEPESEKAAATESTEADSKPGNGVGNDKKTAEAADEKHGKSGHDSHSPAANAPEAAEVAESSVATADKAGRGNPQQASKPESAKAAAGESTEADSTPGNGVGNDKKTAETADVDHGNSEHSNSAKVATTETTEADSKPDNGVGNDKKTAETADVEHGNSAHPTPANAPEAAEIVDPSAATADSAGRGNSEHASEPGSAKAAATELTEADSKPGNGAEHHALASDAASASAAEPAVVEHGNSGHDLPPTSANAPEAAEIVEPSVATGDDAGRGNSQHASESGSAKAAATELAEADFTPGNGVGNGVEHQAPDAANASAAAKTAEPAVVEHGNSGHDLHSTSANAPEAAEIVDPSVATGGITGGGNSQQAAQSTATGLEAALPAKAASETVGADQELVFRFDSVATPSTLVAVVELNHPLDPHVPPGQDKHLEMVVQIISSALDDHAANHGNSGAHHAVGHAAHDLLI
ncbi:DNA-binding NarL/FixJ family response regulator [Bradyrhizobium sp. USDA 377]